MKSKLTLLDSAILNIGSGIAKGVFRYWVGPLPAPIQENLWDSLIDILKNITGDVLAQRSADRQFQVIAERAARNVITVINAEGDRLKEERAHFLIKLVGNTVNKAIASPKLIVEHNNDPSQLTKFLIEFGDTTSEIKKLPQNEQYLFHELLHDASQHIIDIASELPGFTEASFTEILKRENLIINQASRILDEIKRIRESTQDINAEAAAFESDYRREVARRLDELQLFGVNVSETSKRYKLSVAYVSLTVEQNKKQYENEDNIESLDIVKVDDALKSGKRLFIRGPAGSGKTTLLQWLAITSAARNYNTSLSHLNECVPFFIRLRAINDSLPTPEIMAKLTAPNSAGKMPHGWVHKKLESGNAIILIDGLDEITKEKRDEVKDWLKSLTSDFPKARYVISTRPHAAKEGWLEEESFIDTELQDMSSSDIQAFIHHWHASVRSIESSEEKKSALSELEENLSKILKINPALRKLTTSPLLCALICALHRDRIENLPTRRVELYNACVEMFLRRDLERKIKSGNYPELDETQKLTILQELALWMIRGKKSQISHQEADQRIETTINTLQSIPKNTSGENVRRLFVERSGILREPTIGKIDFPHKTFQEYLAARAALDDLAIHELIANAHDDQWHEVIILASGLSRPAEAEELILGLIERGDNEIVHQHTIYLLAVAAQQGINKLPKDSEVIDQVKIRLKKIVPPKSLAEAKSLAAAGDLVTPYLNYNKQILKTAIPIVRCLTLIGTELSLHKLEEYASDRRRGITEELERCYKFSTDPNEFVARFLYQHWFNFVDNNSQCDKQEIFLANKPIRDIRPLSNCIELKNLNLSNTKVEDLTPLVDCHKLEMLHLTNTNVKDLSPLSRCGNLTHLSLNYTQVEDLSPLANCKQLRSINLSQTEVKELTPLTNCKNLTTIDLTNTQLKDLSPLANCQKLKSLDISCNIGDKSSLNKLTQLKSLSIEGCSFMRYLKMPTYDNSDYNFANIGENDYMNASFLTDLTQLESLTISHNGIMDLSPLYKMKKLESLTIVRTIVRNLSSLNNCINIKHLDLQQSDIRDISVLANFKKLESITLNSSRVRDLSPLVNCKLLKSINLNNSNTLDLSPLANLERLETLFLSHCRTHDLSALASCSQLKSLYLSHSKVKDISPLKNLPKLRKLFLEGTHVSDISPLASCSELMILNIRGTSITDISPISHLYKLKFLITDKASHAYLAPITNLIKNGLKIHL